MEHIAVVLTSWSKVAKYEDYVHKGEDAEGEEQACEKKRHKRGILPRARPRPRMRDQAERITQWHDRTTLDAPAS